MGARDAGAKLFISIHADTLNERSVEGATVYTVSDKASDAHAAKLAEKENLADKMAGVEGAEEQDPEQIGLLALYFDAGQVEPDVRDGQGLASLRTDRDPVLRRGESREPLRCRSDRGLGSTAHRCAPHRR